MNRCSWASGSDELMRDYHDTEFGKRKNNDKALFEKLCLECFQAGLSWRTVLYKREAFRRAFHAFDPSQVARMTQQDSERLMQDCSIIRNRRKIDATIHNARLHVVQFPTEGSFTAYVYSFTDGNMLCHDLKKRGYRFLGPTICDSFLGSVGAIEGHEPCCDLYKG
jgi:DNA-3-methyladenine glycosylase I